MSEYSSKYYKAIPKHKQLLDAWCASQVHADLFLWQRVWMLAIARAAPNGHAYFPGNDVADILSRHPDGTVKKVHRQKVWEAIEKLKAIGWLDPSSDRECLVLPAEGLTTGLKGKNKPCPYHAGESPSVRTELLVVDREAQVLCRDTNKRAANPQARAVLSPAIRDQMSPITGHRHEREEASA